MDQNSIAIPLILEKSFLVKAHSHRSLVAVREMSVDMVEKAWRGPGPFLFGFTGSFNMMLNTEYRSRQFAIDFGSMLHKFGIPESHRDKLLYYSTFREQDLALHQMNISRQNALIESSRFLLALVEKSNAYWTALEKDDRYTKVLDIGSWEWTFFKPAIAADPKFFIQLSKSSKDDEVIRFRRLQFYTTTVNLYIDAQYTFSFKGASGKDAIKLPGSMNLDFALSAISQMLIEQKENDTAFYRAFRVPGGFDVRKCAQLADASKRKPLLSNTNTLQRIGLAIVDYLFDNKLVDQKKAAFNFLFEYFSIFKAFNPKQYDNLPSDYNERATYYLQTGRGPEYIKNLMKDATDVGEI